MTVFHNPRPFRPDFWLPIALFVLPVTMMLLPLVIYIEPNRALYYTPLLVKAFLIAIILFAVLSNAARGQGGSTSKLKVALVLMLAAIALFTTLFRAENLAYSAEKLVDLALIFALAFFAKNMFERSGQKLIELSLWAIFGSIVIAVPIMALLFYFRIPEHDLWPNFIPGFVHIRIYGFSLIIAIAVGTGLLASSRAGKPLITICLLAGLLLLWTALFWSGSRSGLAAFLLVFPVMFLLIKHARKALLLGLLPLVIGAALSSQIPAQSEAFGIFNSFEDTFKATSIDRISSGRIKEWQFVLDNIADNPVFGQGFGQRLYIVSDNMLVHVHTHNIVLEAALGWGWVGALLAAGLILLNWFAGLKKVREFEILEYVPAFFVVNVLLVFAWLDGVYIYYQATIPFAICAAILWARFDIIEPQNQG